ncbi:hypothetical protein [Cutibacterium phage FD1]|nr:hypothetical protein [Cutibacterium phage FD1]QPB11672.1 hypothetical protein [Cutibacterium phage PAVL20]QPB11882.1 hypothetical protein [Cutibacterium phage PAVL45]
MYAGQLGCGLGGSLEGSLEREHRDLIYLSVGCVLVVRWSRYRYQHRLRLWCRLAGRYRACLRIRQPYRRWRRPMV